MSSDRAVELLATKLLPHVCDASPIDRIAHARAIAQTLCALWAHDLEQELREP